MSEQTDQGGQQGREHSADAHAGGVITAGPAKKWLIKNLIFLPLAIGFGIWAYVDAVYLYPQRGIEFAEYRERDYLSAAEQLGSAALRYQASVEDPAERLERLRDRRGELNEGTLSQDNLVSSEAERDLALLNWLEALGAVGRVKPEHTTYSPPGEGDADGARPTAEARLEQLKDELEEGKEPKKLAFYDIPSQWVFVVVAGLITANILRLLIQVGVTKYRWAPGEQKLILPGGRSFTPQDLAEPLDKREWHKFKISATLKEGHEAGGEPIRFDTYRYAMLEDWLLTMERTAFPEVVEQGSAGHEHLQAEGEPDAAPDDEPVRPAT